MAYNILIVDDSLTVRSMLTKVVNLSNIELGEILTAQNGKEALDKLHENWIDLVLTDINMPEMTGMELIKAMNDDSLLKSIPIIVITGDGNRKHMKEIADSGVSHYLRKPFTPEEVESTLRSVLEVTDERAGN